MCNIKQEVLCKLYYFIIQTRGSLEYSQVFIKEARRIIPLNNNMRQNIQFIIIKLVLDKKVIVNIIIKNNYKALQEYFLTLEDQKELDNIYIFLKLFKRVIKVYKGNKVTLDQILYLINFLISYFKGTKVYISTIFYYL